MVRGPGGYGRYDDDPEHVGCPYAKSDMSPCIARDGHLALAGIPESGRRDCVGCGLTPRHLITELAAEYEPATYATLLPGTYRRRDGTALDEDDRWADLLTQLVHVATKPTTPASP